MAKQRGTDLDDVADNGGGKRAKITDKVPVAKFTAKQWMTFRLFGPVYMYAGYWVKTKKKDGKATSFYVPCPSWDPKTQQRDMSIPDPWRDLEQAEKDNEVAQADRLVRFTIKGYVNGIQRKEEKNKPRKIKPTKGELKTGFKDKESDTWTPVYAVPLGKGALGKLKDQGKLNVKEVNGQTKAFPLTHDKYGRDVRIMHDPDKPPADQYQVMMGDKRTPLDDDQKAYLTHDLTDLEEEIPTAEVQRDFESWASRNGVKVKGKKKKSKDVEEDDDDFPDDDGDDDDEPKSKKKKKEKAAKKSKKSKDDDEDDDFPDDDGDDDEDDDEPKSKKSKKPAKKKSRDDDDEDDEDDDSDSDDDDDDEDEPKSKKSKKSKSRDDDEDDEEEDDDDDDFDDEPKSKKSKKPAKKKSRDDDEDEEDDDEDDEDDEPKSKKKAKLNSGKKSKSRDDDDDEDEDDDEDGDDDDEDEPKSKSKKSKAKKKSRDDDDDEEDDDFDDEDGDDDDDDEPPAKKKSKKKSKK